MNRPIDPELDLVLERVVPVPVEAVWTAWTNPEHLVKWFTPRPWSTVDCEIDLRPGGIFRTVMRGPDGEESDNTGCYLEVVENERLVFTDALGPDYRPRADPFMTAEIILAPEGDGTRYVAIARHRDPAQRKAHEEMGFHQGWGTALDQLVEVAGAIARV
ncbi:MAG: SRPBCC family protein [Gemmatimonadota bacterium]|nr:SRPBCC family protein [Gemmatimonadota bacterium]